ncbi:YnfU family zinc-binding protein [Klebsiella variicola]|uniref:YnfU family zinc-binding protein n=1 Tax=Klebsiella variicola TaxID=244366 RepID=UPI00222F4FA9|nr:YnfU family zinc-binding protein [Klebsiella variicola]
MVADHSSGNVICNNAKNNRNYLIKCTCPNCINQSEHSYTRVQKGSALMCPHCSKIFTQDKLPLA